MKPRVYHDGGCPICNIEIQHLKDQGHEFEFVDVSCSNFDPTELGVDLKTAQYWLHWMDSEGRIYQGYEANVMMWKAANKPWASVAGHPWVAPVGRLVYKAFARFRGPLGNIVGKFLAKPH